MEIINWQDVYRGDSALVISDNKLGLVIKPYGRKFHLLFPDGTEKTYDASELKFFKFAEYANGGMTKPKKRKRFDVTNLYDDGYVAKEFEFGGDVDEEDEELDYNNISDLEDELRRLTRWSNQYGSKGADEQISQLRKRIEYLKKGSIGMADGGELNNSIIGGLTADEAIYLYVKRAIVQKYREKYLKPAGLWNTSKAKYVEKSLIKKGFLNNAGSINEVGKNKAREVDISIDYMISRSYLSSLNIPAKYKEIVEKFKSESGYMAKGGVTFADKVDAVKSSLLKRKKVSPAVQKDYGKTYSPKEAEDSAKRIVGSQVAKYKR